MSDNIHTTAIVDPSATIGEGTTVGPYTVIGPHCILGKGNRIGSHVVLDGHTEIGDENQIYQFASVGSAPQDLKFHGEASKLTIGNKNIVREYVTLQPGTEGGGMLTSIGSDNLFMACSHVGHDSHIGSNNWFANSTALAGHVEVANFCVLGGMVGVHQFVRLGDFCMLAGGAKVTKDVPPGCLAQGDRAKLVGVNTVGLERRGLNAEEIGQFKKAFRGLFYGKGALQTRVTELREQFLDSPLLQKLFDFVESSERGVVPLRKSDD